MVDTVENALDRYTTELAGRKQAYTDQLNPNNQDSFAFRLKQRRAAQEAAAQLFQQRAGANADKAARGESYSMPSDIFSSFNTFVNASQNAVSPLEKGVADANAGLDKLATDSTELDVLTKLLDTTGSTKVQAKNAYQQVLQEGGQDLLTATTAAEREGQALAIIEEYGSVDNYRKQAPLAVVTAGGSAWAKDFKKASDDASILLESLGAIEAYLPEGSKNQLFGLTGGLQGRKPNIIKNKDAKQVQALIMEFATKKIKELSGVAVSPAEMERLKSWLPDKDKDEDVNAMNVQNIKKGILFNLAVREKAMREGLTPQQALSKYGAELAAEIGYDYGSSKSDSQLQKATEMGTPTSNGFIIEEIK